MTPPDPARPSPSPGVRAAALDLGAAALLIAAAFLGVALSDMNAQAWWRTLPLVFWGVLALLRRIDGSAAAGPSPLREALHWAGVYAAVAAVFAFVRTDHFTQADAGLANGLILALATYLAGVAGQWRVIALGVALGLATVATAWLEEKLWALLGLAVAALVATALLGRLRRRA